MNLKKLGVFMAKKKRKCHQDTKTQSKEDVKSTFAALRLCEKKLLPSWLKERKMPPSGAADTKTQSKEDEKSAFAALRLCEKKTFAFVSKRIGNATETPRHEEEMKLKKDLFRY